MRANPKSQDARTKKNTKEKIQMASKQIQNLRRNQKPGLAIIFTFLLFEIQLALLVPGDSESGRNRHN